MQDFLFYQRQILDSFEDVLVKASEKIAAKFI